MKQKRWLPIAGVVAGIAVAAVVALAAVVITNNGGANSQGRPESAGVARQVGELRLPGDDPLTLDPALVTDTSSATYVVELFSGLVALDKDLKVTPDIAKEWTVSDDGMTYTFKLRDDVVFSGSGRRVTAADVKYSIERAADPVTGSPVADTYLGDIVGAADEINGKAKEISGIKVVDDSTLQITIDRPKPYFLAKLTYPTAFVVDREQIAQDPKNWTRRPNGTGPFVLQEWKIGERVVLTPNDRYYGDPKPSVSRVVFNLAGGSVLTQYESGEVDIAGVGVNDIERVRDSSEKLNAEFLTRPELSTSYIAFNVKQPPFDDPKVRQAFALAVDQDRMAHVILKDLVVPAHTILPPGIPGYSKDQGTTYDPQRARQLLAESKYAGKLPRIVLTQSGTGSNIGPVMEAILESWKQNLGVEVEVEQVETATFFQDVSRGAYQMWSMGWTADYPDPENFLDIQFNSKSTHNDTGYSNAQVDALLDRARSERDTDTRLKLYQQAERIILQDAPWMPLFHGATSVVVKPYVKGWQPTGSVVPVLKYVTVDAR